MTELSFSNVTEADFETLLALRIRVMREHLERLGRFHPDRARKHFRRGFEPQFMRKIWVGADMVGVVSLKPSNDELELEHFYLNPDHQSKGLGGTVLRLLIDEANEQGLSIYLGVLKQSPAARFYERHGFHKVDEEEWDVFYRRDVGVVD